MLPVAASSAAASRRPAVQRPRTGQSRVLQRGRPGLVTSVQSPGAPPAPLAPEDDQDSELELSVRPVQGQEQPAAVPQGRVRRRRRCLLGAWLCMVQHCSMQESITHTC